MLCMNEKTFAKYYHTYYVDKRIIQRIARKLAKNNQALYAELVQIGLITLWKLDPKRATVNEDSWIRQALKNRMIDFLRQEFKKYPKIQSLDIMLESGDQLEQDPYTGLPRLVRNPGRAEFLPKDMVNPTWIVKTPSEDDEDARYYAEELEVQDDEPTGP